MAPAYAVVRVLWPLGLLEFLIDQSIESCHLLGAVVRCRHVQCGDMLVAAVLGACTTGQTLQEAEQQLQHRNIFIETRHDAFQASLAVLGTWSSHAAQQATVPAAAGTPESIWLAVHGKQCLLDALKLGGGWKQQHYQGPQWQLQHCCLPPGASTLQVFLYEMPAAQHSSCQRLQQQHQPGSSLPWMIREPGTITLSSLMQMLQQAHTSIQQHKLLQLKASSLAQQPNQHQQQHAQQLQQQEAQQSIQGPDSGWQSLAAIASWPLCSKQQRWLPQQLHLSCWASPWRLRRPSQQQPLHATMHAGNSSSSSSRSSMPVLPGLLQHLLGIAAAVLLLWHQQVMLQVASRSGAWLQERLLQPHIDWLMQAHPGGVKLHHELSLLLASAATSSLQLSASFYAAAWPLLGKLLLLLVAAVAGLAGAVAGCAAAADALLLLLWPLLLVYVCVAAFHQLQLRCLAATWRLLRGKQKVRRFSERWRQQQQQQQDVPAAASSSSACPQPSLSAAAATVAVPASDEVSVEQLIVGVLLFTPLLGLLPTTTAWYFSVCCFHGVLLLLRLLLVWLGSLLRLQAMHILASRMREPQRFPGELMVQLLQCKEGDSKDGLCGSTPGSSSASRAGSSSRRYSSRKVAKVGAAALDSKLPGEQQDVLLSHYRVFYVPLSCSQVLQLCWAHWREPPGSSAHSSWAAGLLGLVRATVKGERWGTGFFSNNNNNMLPFMP